MRRVLVFVLVIASFVACKRVERNERPKLVLYCSAQIEWCQLMAAEFERSTGIHVSMTRKSSGETYAEVWAERRNPKGDVWWGGTGDAHIQAAEVKLTEPYVSPRAAELHDWAKDPVGDGAHRTTGIYLGALGFAYNTDWIRRKGLPGPKTWKDLADPIYRGEIQVANPNSSGTAYTMLATILELYGEEDGWTYLRRLHQNVNQYTKSGASPMSAVARGETGIGISFLHDAVTQKAAGLPVEVVVPEEGTGFEIGCVSIIHGARHPENAKRFLDWSLSKEAEELGAKAAAYQWPSNVHAAPPPGAPNVAALKLLRYDYPKYAKKEVRERILKRWEAEVSSVSR
jgi:iron(III) transport system substrate-binding protein